MHLAEHINLKGDEKIVFFLRRHWFTFAGDIAVVLFLSLAPVGGYAIFRQSIQNLVENNASWEPMIILAASAYYLAIWAVFLTKFVDYYLDSWIVTSHRVLNIEQNGLFSRTVSELDLSRVQDITSEVKGVIESILDYGDVFIQTAGEVQRFDFEDVPHPHKVREHILELVEVDKKKEH